jgi:hypothetical protein
MLTRDQTRNFVIYIPHLALVDSEISEGPPLRSSGQSSWLQNEDVFPVRYKLHLYMLCRRK